VVAGGTAAIVEAAGNGVDVDRIMKMAAAAAATIPAPPIQRRYPPFFSSSLRGARAGAALGMLGALAGAATIFAEEGAADTLPALPAATRDEAGLVAADIDGLDAGLSEGGSSSKSSADASFVSFARSAACGSAWAIIFKSTMPESPGARADVGPPRGLEPNPELGGTDESPGSCLTDGGPGVNDGELASFARSFRLRRSRSLSIGGWLIRISPLGAFEGLLPAPAKLCADGMPLPSPVFKSPELFVADSPSRGSWGKGGSKSVPRDARDVPMAVIRASMFSAMLSQAASSRSGIGQAARASSIRLLDLSSFAVTRRLPLCRNLGFRGIP
jgi:hypothetical protein